MFSIFPVALPEEAHSESSEQRDEHKCRFNVCRSPEAKLDLLVAILATHQGAFCSLDNGYKAQLLST